jgi:group I intron endonuclease
LVRIQCKYIYNALLYHGYSAFSLTILEYIDINNLSNNEAKRLILEKEQYYIDTFMPEFNIQKIAGSALGQKRSDKTKSLMSEAKKGENNPMFGKFGTNHPLFRKPQSEEIVKRKTGENSPMFGRVDEKKILFSGNDIL